MPPENLPELTASFIESMKDEFVKAVAMVLRRGYQPEDFIFVAATPDNNSQQVAALALGLTGDERQPLRGVAAVERDWLFARLEPIYAAHGAGRSHQALSQPEPGSITLWLMVNNWPVCAKMALVGKEGTGTVPSA